MRTVLKSATFLATENVNSVPFKSGERGANFWQGKVQNYSPILRWTCLARKSAKLIANFSTAKVTSLPSVSASLSLSLSLSHRAHLTHNVGSTSALPTMGLVKMLQYSLYYIFNWKVWQRVAAYKSGSKQTWCCIFFVWRIYVSSSYGTISRKHIQIEQNCPSPASTLLNIIQPGFSRRVFASSCCLRSICTTSFVDTYRCSKVQHSCLA